MSRTATRIVEGNTVLNAALAAGATQTINLNGNSPYEVPTDFVLLITQFASSLFSGTLVFEVSDSERAYQSVATIGMNKLSVPYIFKSGSRVTALIRNIGAAGSGGTAVYAVTGILVPSVDFETYWPQNVSPFVPNPL